MKRMLCLLLPVVMVLGIFSACGGSQSAETAQTQLATIEQIQTQEGTEPTSEIAIEVKGEVAKARELGLLPAEWDKDLLAEADFDGFNQLVISFVNLCDVSALSVWQENVNDSAFPARNMRRDDGLVLLMLAAEALGYNTYNAREYGFCTENYVNYDTIFSQISWDYPYCDAEREIPMYFSEVGGDEDPIGNVPSSAVFWM